MAGRSRRRGRRHALIALVGALTVGTAACASGTDTDRQGASGRAGDRASRPDGAPAATTSTVPVTTTSTSTTVPIPVVDRVHAIGIRRDTYLDPTRPTSAAGSYPGAPSRTFPVTYWYPADGDANAAPAEDAPLDRRGGPYPLIVFAHGWAVPPEFFEAILLRWAAAGYVVAAPAYPLLSGIPAGPSHADYALSFEDTTFVLTQVLRDVGSGPGAHPLAGMVDSARVAAAGHSDGQAIAYGVGFLECCRDPRIKAVVAMAGDLGNINNPVQRGNDVPILHLISERDEFNGYGSTVHWDREVLTAPKWSVTLVNAPHTPPYVDPGSPYFDGVATLTVDFLDATLKSRTERLERIARFVEAHSGLFRLET